MSWFCPCLLNYTRMLRTVLNKSWRQHPTRHQLYGHLPSITKTIQVRRTRHAGHCWRSKDELISDVLLWTPTYGRAKAGRPARTYIQQLCEDTGCNPEDLPEAMNDRETWRERVRDIRAGGTTWWWWCSMNCYLVMLYIDLRPGGAVKIGNAPVYITGASGQGIAEYNLDCGWVQWVQFVTPTRRRWALNYYITQFTGNSISWRQDAVEKASNQEREPSGPRLRVGDQTN